mmetsp:Transcript_32659/g.85824  ORF Transcript_32659/g.85824 Transcript_32659/m.85824 type:complete len:89 (+) Transcript_32659:1685-1951(+)
MARGRPADGPRTARGRHADGKACARHAHGTRTRKPRTRLTHGLYADAHPATSETSASPRSAHRVGERHPCYLSAKRPGNPAERADRAT